MMSTGLVFNEGPEWKEKRKIMSSVFNYEFVESKIPFISKITKDVLNSLENLL
jgi:cytochrome P450